MPATDTPKDTPKDPPHVHTIRHPLAAAMLSVLRDRETPPSQFRDLIRRLSALLAYEATRDLLTVPWQVRTPLEEVSGVRMGPVVLVPILRAGLGMADGMLAMIPDAQVGHIGMFRDEDNLSPVTYYVKLPAIAPEAMVLLVDPMLATGGSAAGAVTLLKQHGCRDIRFACLIAAPEGVRRVHEEHPGLPIHTISVDRQLNDKGYILPGLGDAGDRIFGTLE
jgi:uracil phosphoribosyltransferase